jgi:hypothetical protein
MELVIYCLVWTNMMLVATIIWEKVRTTKPAVAPVAPVKKVVKKVVKTIKKVAP